MEKYKKKRKRLYEMSSRHLRRLVQNEVNLVVEHNDRESLSEICTLPDISTSAKMSYVNESDNDREIVNQTRNNNNMNILTESNEIRNNAVHLANLNITENVKEKKNFKSLLRNWAVTNNINHVALTGLFKVLRTHECFSNLPVDARTLLRTPKSTNIKTVLPGLYSYFGVRVALEEYFRKCNHKFDNINTINLGINNDGLPLSKSSTSSLWPILGCILPYKEIFIIGAYYGSKKPTNCNEFLQDFVKEMIELINNGIFYVINFTILKLNKLYAMLLKNPSY